MSIQSLATAELSVMNVIWNLEEATAREILELLYPQADRPQHGTVQRLLQRLEEKEFVVRDRGGPVQCFKPRLSRREYACIELERLAESLSGGSLPRLIEHLVAQGRLSWSEIVQDGTNSTDS